VHRIGCERPSPGWRGLATDGLYPNGRDRRCCRYAAGKHRGSRQTYQDRQAVCAHAEPPCAAPEKASIDRVEAQLTSKALAPSTTIGWPQAASSKSSVCCRRPRRWYRACAMPHSRRAPFQPVGAGARLRGPTTVPRDDDIYTLPPGLVAPVDDGACSHLAGTRLPSLMLASTSAGGVDLAGLPGRTVVYCYPRTGRPHVAPPTGWDDIPGARGCTPQSCAFRDLHGEIRSLGAAVFGLSTQSTAEQREAVDRLHLPFELLSDAELRLTNALRLPTFQVDGMTLLKRLTLILAGGRVEKVFYPVFPPDRNASDVAAWLAYRCG
jgi:peroxiredoxin